MKKTMRSIVIVMMSLLMWMNTGMQVQASEDVDLNRRGTVSIALRDGLTKKILGGTFTIYKVATVTDQGGKLSYTFTSEFRDSGASLDDLEAEGLARHLSNYARDPYSGIEGTTMSANSEGKIVFNNLSVAIYLLVQEGSIPGYYQASPFLISMPVTDVDGKYWVYDVDVAPKVVILSTNGLTDRSVMKKWKDTGNVRPDSISVSLLCDGKVFETVTLNEQNKWQHKWEGLDVRCTWDVVEKVVPKGYTVSYETTNDISIITNTENPPPGDPPPENPPPENPPPENPPPENPPPEDPPTTVTTTTTTTYTSTTPPEERKTVIQTGQLRWPIPLLAFTGMLLLLYGWRKMIAGEKEQSED